ncbi:MAG: hypothetical protein WC686_05320, partial [Candidatus Shapirobacteria bacterium]
TKEIRTGRVLQESGTRIKEATGITVRTSCLKPQRCENYVTCQDQGITPRDSRCEHNRGDQSEKPRIGGV